MAIVGDVKYHLGHSLDRSTPDGLSVHLSLFPNPSHLEAVDPVIMEKTRAKQYFNNDFDTGKTCAIIIHGDASFSGQGVVYESMALMICLIILLVCHIICFYF